MNDIPTNQTPETESPKSKIKISIVKNGPARVECDEAEIISADGSKETREQIVLICRCACSKRMPFCDGAHRAFKFEK